MKRLYLKSFVAAFICLLYSYSASGQNFLWAKGAHAGVLETYGSQCITLDHAGYVYSVSRADPDFGPCYLGTDSLPAGTFIVKNNASTGEMEWIISGLNTFDYNSIITDKADNLYYEGSFYDSLSFGDFTMTPTLGAVNCFLVKLDPSGNAIWAKQSADTTFAQAVDITMDTAGNVFMAGHYAYSPFILDDDTLATGPCDDCYNTFVIKLDSGGNVLWARSIVPTGAATTLLQAYSVTTDMEGDVYVAVAYSDADTVTYKPVATGTDTISLPSSNGMLLAKFSPAGSIEWLKAYSNIFPALMRSDGHNGLYMTGDFDSTVALGGATLHAVGSKNTFVARLDTAGNVLWAKTGGYAGKQYTADGMYVDASGGLYTISGIMVNGTGSHFQMGDSVFSCVDSALDVCYITKLDSAGNVLSDLALNSGGDDWLGITGDNSGNLYISGDYEDSLVLTGDSTLHNVPPTFAVRETYFVTKYGKLPNSLAPALPAENVAIYPNPAQRELHITADAPIGDVVIVNMLGETVMSAKVTGRQTTLSIGALPEGVYAITLHNEVTRTFVKR